MAIRIYYDSERGLVSTYDDVGNVDLPSLGLPKTNSTTTNPTVTNDVTQRYTVGSRWWNTNSSEEFVCLASTQGAAMWSSTTSGGGSGSVSSGGGDPEAQYLVLATTASLSNERAFTPSIGLFATDAGPGNAYAVGVNDSIVATLTGSVFTGNVKFNSGLSGSLQQTTGGLSYLVAGSNVTVTSASNGQVTIAGTTFAPLASAYVTIGSDTTLTSERSLTAGTGLFLTDAGANSTVTLGVNDRFFAALTGSTFSGPIVASSTGGITGSITKVPSGISYIAGSGGTTVVSASNGQITVSSPRVALGSTVWVADSSVSSSVFPTSNVRYVPLRNNQTDAIEFQFVSAISGSLDVYVLFAMSSSEANVVSLQFDNLELGLGSNPSTAPTLGAAFNVTPGTDVLIHSASFNESSTMRLSANVNDVVYCRLTRSGSADSHAGDLRVLEVRVI